MSLLKRVFTAAKALRHTGILDDDFAEKRNELDAAIFEVDRLPDLPHIVCLCGSTRFKEEFIKQNFERTMAGQIVLSVGWFTHADPSYQPTEVEKEGLDDLHKRKIDLADEVLVINVNGYLGESTVSEIRYALKQGKPVTYLVSSDHLVSPE